MLSGEFKTKCSIPICETFDRAAFDYVLAKPGCVGLRVYFAMDDDDMLRVVIVGVNEKGADMVDPSATQTSAFRSSLMSADSTSTDPDPLDDPSGIIEQGTRCPDICPPDSPLNT